jgi:DNA-binding GntR family transcriptional regulator
LAQAQIAKELGISRGPVREASRLARHLSRTALTVLMLVAPEHDPQVVRTAVRQVTGPVAPASRSRPRARV